MRIEFLYRVYVLLEFAVQKTGAGVTTSSMVRSMGFIRI
jgi:hypothetical protein